MRRLTRPLAFAAGVGIVVAGIAATTPPTPATAQESPIFKQSGLDEGWVVLETSTGARPGDPYETNSIGFLSKDDIGTDGLTPDDYGEIDWRQTISAGKDCQLLVEPVVEEGVAKSPLVRIDGVNASEAQDTALYAGVVGDSIGVRYTGKGKFSEGTGTPCGEANANEDKGEILVQALKVTGVGGVLFSGVDADIEAKYDADVAVDFTLLDGTTSTSEVYISGNNDNNPDSGPRDNFPIIAAPSGGAYATAVTFKPINAPDSGAVSLEGGSDGTLDTIQDKIDDVYEEDLTSLRTALGTGATIFEVTRATAVLDCTGEKVTVGDVEITHLPAGAVPIDAGAVPIDQREQNTCTENLPFLIERESEGVVLVSVPTDATTDAYVVTIPFPDQPAESDYTLLTPTTVDYLLTNADGSLREDSDRIFPLELCNGSYPGENGQLYSQLVMPIDVLPDDGNQGVCGISRTTTFSSFEDDVYKVDLVETVLIVGDPFINAN